MWKNKRNFGILAFLLFNLIMLFNTDLQLLNGYGVKVIRPPYGTDTAQDHFYGPHYFIARRREEFFIMDEMGSESGGEEYDKLVYVEDMDGNGWDYNDSFDFFYEC